MKELRANRARRGWCCLVVARSGVKTTMSGHEVLVSSSQKLSGIFRAQSAPRGVVVVADTLGIGFSSALRSIQLDPEICSRTSDSGH